MRASKWLKSISLIVLFAMGFQSIGVPITLAHLVLTAAEQVAPVLPEPAGDALEAAARELLAEFSPEAWAAPAAAPLAAPLSAPLCHDPGDTNSLYEDEDTCLDGEAAGSSISYAGRKLSLSHTLGSAGPLLVLRYDSRPQPVPMVLNAWVPTLLPLQRWTIQIAGWTFEGEGSQPLALWDTTDKATGDLVPAGVYDMEIQYENEMGVGSTLHSVIVQRPAAGPAGAHWWHNYEVRLEVVDDERVLIYAQGFAQLFTGKDDRFSSTSAQGHTLTREEDGTWRWLRDGADGAPIQGVTTIDAEGRAVRWEEPTGRSLSFVYDDQGRLVSVTDQSGRVTRLAYEGERISTVTDAAGSIWRLSYDGEHLVSLSDPLEAAWALDYDSEHRLVAKTDPLGYRTEYRYAPDGALTEIIDPAGHRVTFATELNMAPYISADVQTIAPVLGTTIVSYISASGLTTSEHRYSYDAHGRVVRLVRSPDGGATEYVWTRTWGWGDNSGVLLSETDAAGLTTTYTYRGGTALVERLEAGPLPAVKYGYKQINGYWTLTSLAIGSHSTTAWKHDAQGRRISVEQAALRWYYRYDDDVNAYGQPSAMVWNWNGQGDPTRSSEARLIRYAYDAAGQLVSSEDPGGGLTQYGYDDAGRMVSITDALGRTRTIAYDAAGRIVKQVDALGGETQYTYDGNGNLIVLTDAAGSRWSYTYDYAGRVIRIADPLERSTTLTYGNEGELLARTDARGDTVCIENDALGRPLTFTYPGGQAWHVSYDAADNVTSLSGQGWLRVFQRDAAGRALLVADVRDGRTTWVSYRYDGDGQVDEMRTSEGERTTYLYGSVGEVKRISGPLGETEYTYETSRQLAPQRVAIRTGPLRTDLTYDVLGRVAEMRQYQQGAREGLDRTTVYTYDAVGNILALQTPEGTRTYGYDALDRLVTYVDIAGVETAYAYDAVGNRTSIDTGDAAPVLYRYDEAHQLLQAGDTVYAYDRNGRLISSAGPDSLRRYSWDYQGRLSAVSESSPCGLPFPLSPDCDCDDELVSYRYALTGERVETVRRGGAPETLRYDGAHASATLNSAGQIVDARQQGALWDEWTVVSETSPDGAGSALVRHPLAEGQGNLVGAVDEQGALAQQATYDPWGAPVVAGDQAEAPAVSMPGFQGHLYEAETGLYDLRARWYDPALGRFISPDPVRMPFNSAGLNPYAFGMNNPLRYTDPTGEVIVVSLVLAAAIVGAAFYASYSGASYAFSTTWECFSGWEMAKRIAVGAAIGAAVGAGGYLAGVAGGAIFGTSAAGAVVSGMLAGATAGAFESTLSQLFLEGKSVGELDGTDIIKSVLIGALAGGVAGGMTNMFNKPMQFAFDFIISKLAGGLGGSLSTLFFGV